jgi:hypothetical protein
MGTEVTLESARCTFLHTSTIIERSFVPNPLSSADKSLMWPLRTYRRGAERLSLHVREGNRGVTLVVSGDDDLRSYSFRDVRAMMKFEAEMEEFLLYAGWRPIKLTEEEPLPEETSQSEAASRSDAAASASKTPAQSGRSGEKIH